MDIAPPPIAPNIIPPPLLLLGLGLALLFLGVAGFVLWSLLHPPRRTVAWAIARGRPRDPSQVVTIAGGTRAYREWTLDGTVGGLFGHTKVSCPVWDIDGDDPSGPIVIMTHGWGDSRWGQLSRLPSIASQASRVVVWDLPGHGEATGTTTLGSHEPGLLRELIEIVARDAGTKRIVLFGSSMGGGTSLVAAGAMASDGGEVCGVFVEAPYRWARTPAANVISAAGMPTWGTLDLAMGVTGLLFGKGFGWQSPRLAAPFDRAWHAGRTRVPVLVLHGSADDVSPMADGRAIADAAPKGELVTIEGGGHHGLWIDPRTGPECSRAWAGFIGRIHKV